MKKRMLWILAGSLLFGCHRVKPESKPSVLASDDPTKAWVALAPVQCLGNPWEKVWLKAHKNKGSKYPMREEVKIMKRFFKEKGFVIHDLRIRPYLHDKVLGRACNSPRGDLLLMLVNTEDVSLMRHYGFQPTVPVGTSTPDKK